MIFRCASSHILLGNMLIVRGMKSEILEWEVAKHEIKFIWAGEGTIRACEGTSRAGQDF